MNRVWQKGLITMVFCAFVFLSVPDVAHGFAGGSGTSGDPYQITTAAELASVSSYLSGKYFKVMNDIDLNVAPYNSGSGWTPLGSSGTYFTGVFDGNGKTISNLFISRSSTDYVGLFGSNTGTIKNVKLTGANVTGHYITGALVGYNGGTVASSSASGATTAYHWSGGMFGSNSGGLITGCASYVNFTGTSGAQVVGSLTGENYSGGRVRLSYAQGNVTSDSSYAGGASGSNYSSTATDVYSTGVVSSTGSGVGGLWGGSTNGAITNSYWDTQTSGKATTVGGGTGATTAQMKTQSTYSGWDFTNIWAINASVNNGYPYLQWQNLVVDSTAPTVSVTTPTASEATSSTVTLSASASDETSCDYDSCGIQCSSGYI